jgi:hypothetical protein
MKNKTTKKEFMEKMLTDEQATVVKAMIVQSMECAYTDKGENPTDAFYGAAGRIADGVVNDVQKTLLQNASFQKAVLNSKPLKTKKSKK